MKALCCRLSLAGLILCSLAPRPALAQEIDLGNEVTGYQRFVVYPHLQKAFESMRAGDRQRAIAEFERAHALAPESTIVVLHLVNAYRTFGDTARAESVLRKQLQRAPGDARLLGALAELRQPPRADVQARSKGPAVPARPEGGGRPPGVPEGSPAAAAPARPVVSQPVRHANRPAPPKGAVASPAIDPRESFNRALEQGWFDEAVRVARPMLASAADSMVLLDHLSYQLAQAGAVQQASQLLLEAYPYQDAPAPGRETLFVRLTMLADGWPELTQASGWARLRVPLDTPALRSRQAAFWASRQDCSAVLAVLGDMSPEYGYDEWLRVGDCATADFPLMARQAYERAHTVAPGGRGSRELAYLAYAEGAHATALAAWRSVDAERMSAGDLLGAVTTALAAADDVQAAAWLDVYANRGESPNHRYWSLRAQSLSRTDRAGARQALEHAVDLEPRADDFLQLATLQDDVDRQIAWLERAAALDRSSGDVQLELGYAYSRAGRTGDARAALEHAAALRPNDVEVLLQLGYVSWEAGDARRAEHAFERAWRADPGNLSAARQLVYVHQRLSHNDKARSYARHVLDAEPTAAEESAGRADRRFGLQRLHEDLGRRVTVNFDGWTGTRVGTGTSGSQAGSRYRSYSQVEADVRLTRPSIRDGKTVSAYARVLADGGDQRKPAPSENAMLGLGMRWKPWRNQVVYLAGEHQSSLEDDGRQQDVLLRASASFLNGGPYGDDWHASGGGWFAQNLYLDVAHYMRGEHSALTVDYRTSLHRKIAASQTLEPYAHVQFNGVRNGELQRDARVGGGMRWNLWHGGTRHDAHPHKLTLGVEFQQAFETYLEDRNGLFVTIGTRW